MTTSAIDAVDHSGNLVDRSETAMGTSDEAHLVLGGRGHDTDLFVPDSAPDVAAGFHTDRHADDPARPPARGRSRHQHRRRPQRLAGPAVARRGSRLPVAALDVNLSNVASIRLPRRSPATELLAAAD
ncbi:hypothetical protein G7043_34800 [Lentzea sp. NEAU-D13]|uniref:Uncharacterized protein n=1 Tax=Lentzea alba TaxID=2714351 RepID=A0A7C9RXC6_9PSEU|nr:hypothetical protein [Lentzea alba]NGY64103.1 hypothetical protein [Lentzea alba]